MNKKTIKIYMSTGGLHMVSARRVCSIATEADVQQKGMQTLFESPFLPCANTKTGAMNVGLFCCTEAPMHRMHTTMSLRCLLLVQTKAGSTTRNKKSTTHATDVVKATAYTS